MVFDLAPLRGRGRRCFGPDEFAFDNTPRRANKRGQINCPVAAGRQREGQTHISFRYREAFKYEGLKVFAITVNF